VIEKIWVIRIRTWVRIFFAGTAIFGLYLAHLPSGNGRFFQPKKVRRLQSQIFQVSAGSGIASLFNIFLI